MVSLNNYFSSRKSSRTSQSNDLICLKGLQKSPKLFCAYLALNAKGWKRISTYHYKPNDIFKKTVNSAVLESNDIQDEEEAYESPISRSDDGGCFTREDHGSRGFEIVWLADQDAVTTNTKAWNSGEKVTIEKSKKPELAIWSIAISDDREFLAVGTSDGLIFVWSLHAPRLDSMESPLILRRVATVIGHTGGVMRLQWNHECTNPRVLLSCGFDQTVRLWSIHPSTTLCILRCPDLPVGVTFITEAKAVVTCLDGATRIIQFKPSPRDAAHAITPLINCHVEQIFNQEKVGHAATHMSLSPSKTKLAVGSQFGIVSISDLQTGELIKQITCRNHHGKYKTGEKVTGVSWDSTSQFIAVTSRDGRIRIVDTDDPQRYLKLKAKSDPRLVAIFDPSNRFLLAAAENGHVFIWDLKQASNGPVIRRHHLIPPALRRNSNQHLPLFSRSSGPSATPFALTDVMPLKSEWKRETSGPVASFPAKNVTAMAMIPFFDGQLSSVSIGLIIVGTDTGVLSVYLALLSS